jgi:endonuclease-3
VGVIDQQEKEKWLTPGLERSVPKNRGVEFSTLLHQLGAELSARPYGPVIKSLLLEIDPSCKDRLPKRPSRKKKPEVETPAEEAPAKTKKAAQTKKDATTAVTKKVAEKPAKVKQSVSKKATAKKTKPPVVKKKTKAKTANKSASKVKKKTKTTTKTKTSKRITRRKPK